MNIAEQSVLPTDKEAAPITEELSVCAYFCDEEGIEELIDSFPGNYLGHGEDEESGEDFIDLSCELMRKEFMKAWETLKPLFDSTRDPKIQIVIDHFGVFSGEASYFFGRSNPEKGSYVFTVNSTMLYSLLKNYWEGKDTDKPFDEYIWHHEIIHLIDHNNIMIPDRLRVSKSRSKWILNHLLSFRTEGLADLLYNLKGYGKFKSLDEPRVKFRDEMERIINLTFNKDKGKNDFQKELRQGAPVYSIGPWMLLHALTCPENPEGVPEAIAIVERMQNGETISDSDLLPIISCALKIGNGTFLNYLTEPGFDGKPFIDPSDMTRLVASTGPVVSHPYGKTGDTETEQLINGQIDILVRGYNQYQNQ
jgi:hypothetical protein